MEELNDADLASIVEQTETSTNQEIPMTNESVEASAPVETPPTPQEYEFDYGGQKIKAPVEKILKWASMGYGAPNKIGELSNKLRDYEGKLKQYEPYDKVYKPIDEWAKSNPEKWQSLLQGWQQAQYGVTPNPEQAAGQPAIPPEILKEIQESKQFREELVQKETIQRERAADQGLDGEIQSIRKQFSNLDFDAPDESGNSLEYQILKHATDNGIPSFRAAFRDYCFDKLNSFSETKGREAAKVSPKTRAGLLGKEQAPTKGRSTPDLKNRNYDQIHSMILEEYGLG